MNPRVLTSLLVLFTWRSEARRTLLSATRSTAARSVTVRGGAGPLNPTDVAKVATLVAGSQASLNLLSPRRTLEVYGLPEGVMMELLNAYQGAEILGFALQAYFLLFREADLKAAIAVSTVPRCIYSAKVLWNEDYKTIGFSPVGPMLHVSFGVLVMLSCLLEASFAEETIKAYAVVNILNGLISLLVPGVAVNVRKLPESEWHSFSVSGLGASVLGVGAYQAALAWDVDPLKAFGLAWVPSLIFTFKEMVKAREFDNIQIPKLPIAIWMMVQCVVIGTCSIGKHLEHHEGTSPI